MIGVIVGSVLIVLLAVREVARAGLPPADHGRLRPLTLVTYPLLVVFTVIVAIRLGRYL
jgi:hypothetical protein